MSAVIGPLGTYRELSPAEYRRILAEVAPSSTTEVGIDDVRIILAKLAEEGVPGCINPETDEVYSAPTIRSDAKHGRIRARKLSPGKSSAWVYDVDGIPEYARWRAQNPPKPGNPKWIAAGERHRRKLARQAAARIAAQKIAD
jgi:hypothetical protein